MNQDEKTLYVKLAYQYYQNKEYYRASVLFEEVLPILKGRPEAELAQFDFAYSYYYQKQYVLSAHYFQTFYQLYSRSQYAEEALFMYAYSLYMDSPDFDLDQSSTEDAIQASQNFLNKFPRSKYRDKADSLIDEMQVKLELKAYENAMLYYKLEKYLDGEALKAAIIAFDNFQTDYPDSKYNEDVSFYKIECAFKMAKKSIRSKQEDRLREAITYYYYFIDKFPQSARVKDAENLFEDIQNSLTKTKGNNM